MTRPVVLVLVVCFLATTGLWSKPVSSSAAKAKAKMAVRAKAVSAKTAARRTPSKGRASAAASKSTASKFTAAKRYSPPAAPSSDRIKEIQQALLDRGYLSSEPDGVWSAQCVDALKRFESDKKFKIDGKIDSRILISLGLGPKYDENLSLPVPGSAGIVVADDNKIDFQRFN
jgi:peptidoglycan hydrolase-like protein with peptidoglycan-binding domain